MKTRFTTIDIIAALEELQQYVGYRVNQVYDIDNKTYLLKLQKPECKAVLLIESGTRIHTTEFEWPKNPAPSGFSMKLRKHINNKRVEKIEQMGVDRVLDLQFGSGEAAYHLVLEMYDRGNLVLTDAEYKIMNILRPRVAGEEKFLVRETYPVELAKQHFTTIEENNLKNLLKSGKPADTVKKVLMPHFDYGPSVLEHICLEAGIRISEKLKDFNVDENLPKLYSALSAVTDMLTKTERKGIVIQKAESRPTPDGGSEQFFTFQEFHPYLYLQHTELPKLEFPTFNSACDNFFSQLEAQKIELKTVQQERNAMKKLENVKKDHETRIRSLQELQALDRRKGELIEMNSKLVENAIRVVVSAIANQIPWDQIKEIIKEATDKGDPVASRVKHLKLEINHIVMHLHDPYSHLDEEYGDSEEEEENPDASNLLVDIDLDLSAQANARKYFVQKKTAAVKEKKTVESGGVALKSAEKKTKQTLKEMATISNINKARKVYWFEKFFWFISSENFLVIGGRDAQQNETIVKRYMKPNDVYVHADLHGAASIVIKNNSGHPVPPKTLNEAAQFSVCFSAAWDSKVVTSAYWVNPEQVSKTAPSGEYLTVGSFMIRGKKNFLPPSYLIMGFGFLLKLEESSIARHKDERRVRGLEESVSIISQSTDLGSEADLESVRDGVEEMEIDVEGGDSSDEEKEEVLETIAEETPAVKEVAQEEREDEAEEEENGEEDKDEQSEEEQEEAEDKPEIKQEEEMEFPDTDIKRDFSRSVSTASAPESLRHVETRPKQNNKKAGEKGETGHKKGKEEEQKKNIAQIRGKKGKMKKIKEKYKDQDDEEREIRMKLLQGENVEKPKKVKKKQKGSLGVQPQKVKRPPPKKPAGPVEGEVEEEKAAVNDETDMLDSLTGMPVVEDELLFAIPVCAPYSTLVNYKYKVKLTPGTGKRGKACKTALNMFIMDKSTIQREKDLLKSVKDQDLARNLPGKVKLSAPHLQKVKGKK